MTTLPDFDTLWDYDHPDQTEQRFRELLPQAEQSGDLSYRLQLLTQIARTQGLQRRFDEAHNILDQVESLLSKALKTARIRYLLERGRVYNSSKNPASAQPLFLQAWKLAKAAHQDFYAVDAAHMLAIVASPKQQMTWNLKALRRAETSTDPRARSWLGSLYNNIGWTYHDSGKYQKALEIFQKALTWRESFGTPQTTRIARWCVGRCLRSLNRIDEALALQRALLANFEQAGQKDGYVHEELGECLLLQGSAEAAQHFARAYQILLQDAWLAENEPARIERLKTLGNIA